MATVARRSDYSIETLLYTQAFEFDFHQTIRILEALKPEAMPFGEGVDPLKEALRVQSRITMSSSSSDIYSIKFQRPHIKPPILTVNFLGIAGIQGPLATPYTEMLIERLRQKDTAFRDFLDIFNHRLVSLWHRAHKKTILGLEQVKPQFTAVGKCFFDLVGLSSAELKNHLDIPDRSLLNFAPLFWQRTKSAAGLQQLLQVYFKTPIHIHELQGAWRRVPNYDWSLIGKSGQHNLLGQSLVLGKRSWDQAAGVKIILPRLTWSQYLTHLPGGKGHKALLSLSRLYCGMIMNIEVVAEITAKEIPPLHLGQSLLGQTSWITRGKGLGFKANPTHQLAHVCA